MINDHQAWECIGILRGSGLEVSGTVLERLA